MDPRRAVEALKTVEQAGTKAGDAVARGMKEAQQATHGAAGAAKDFGSELAGLAKAQVALAVVRSAANAMSDEYKRSTDYVRELAKNFADLRQALQQVAALKGEKNTNQFTLEEAQKAAASGLTPQEWVKAQEEFQSGAGAYLEGDQARATQQQGEDYQARIAAFAKARGIAPSEAMPLGGGLLQFSEGQQTPEKLMERYGRVFKTLERAPTPVSQLLPQMSRIMSQGFAPEEAAQALAIMSEAMPGEEQTGVENTLKALTEARHKGKGEELGLQEGMTPMQQIEAASRRLKGRAAKGENLDEMLAEYAPDLRERRGLLGFMNRGVGAKGFERVRGYAAETPADFTAKAIAEYQASDEGQAAQRRANQALAETRRGQKYQDLQAELEKARAEQTQAGYREYGSISKSPYDWTISNLPGMVGSNEADVNARAIGNLRRRAAGLGITGSTGSGAFQRNRATGDVDTSDVGYRTQQSVDNEIRELLKRIAAATEKLTEQRAAAMIGGSLAAVMPRPTGRM
jgi:hypothetical protein